METIAIQTEEKGVNTCLFCGEPLQQNNKYCNSCGCLYHFEGEIYKHLGSKDVIYLDAGHINIHKAEDYLDVSYVEVFFSEQKKIYKIFKDLFSELSRSGRGIKNTICIKYESHLIYCIDAFPQKMVVEFKDDKKEKILSCYVKIIPELLMVEVSR